MKFAKLSLAAIAAMGVSTGAMALNLSKATIKPYVNTKLYYETVDHDYPDAPDLFNQDASSGQALVQVGASGNLNGCWGYGLEYSVADTLGLENDIVSKTRMGNGEPDGPVNPSSASDTQGWMSQAYITFRGCGTSLKNTTFKMGRQYLDTPLAFTETWNLAPNSFDAIVVANTDISNVTLVGAYIGKGNGDKVVVTNGNMFRPYGVSALDYNNTNGNNGQYHTGNARNNADGAYAVGILTNFGLPVNLWYYNVKNVATAWWADATTSINGIKFGIQYGSMNPDDTTLNGVDDTAGGAIKVAGSLAGFNLMAAYSKMDDDGLLALANTATIGNSTGGKKTKLYTAGIYTDGTGVAVPGSKAYKLKVSTGTPVGKFTAQYVSCTNDSATYNNGVFQNGMTNVDEIDLVLGTKVLGINTKLIYINRDVDTAYEIKTQAGGLKHDTQHVRIVLSKKF